MTVAKAFTEQTGWDYETAFCRNRGLITEAEQEVLRNATVAIPGLGGVGGSHLMTLARLGIGGFHIADADEFSVANFNRQFGAMTNTVDRSKLEVMRDFVRSVNPEVRLKTWDCFIDSNNVDEFIDGCQIIVDSVDAFSIDARLTLWKKAYEKKIPILTAGPLGFSSAMIIQTESSMSFWDYLDIDEEMPMREKFIRFVIGVTPRPHFLRYMNTEGVDLNTGNGPSVASSVALCSGFVAVEVVKLLLGRGKVLALPYYHYYDPYLSIFRQARLLGGNRNPLQRILIWYMDRYKIPKGTE